MKPIRILLCALIAAPFLASAQGLTCDNGSLNDSECRITDRQNITGETVSTTGTDVIVENTSLLYTDPKTYGNDPIADIDLGNGRFIVKSGGVVYGNVNISAERIFVLDGGIIDATGLGYQTSPRGKPPCPYNETPDGYCLSAGPAGGSGSDGNSNTGAGGGGHAGKGGSYRDSSNSYVATGGGRGMVNNETYGNRTEALTYGSAGGAEGDASPGPLTLDEADGAYGHQSVSAYNGYPELIDLIRNATRGTGVQDDPDNDREDSDYWHPDNIEYRAGSKSTIYLGSGGGRISLLAGSELVINGTVLSNGLDAGGAANDNFPMGGGAGGSIRLVSGGMFGDGVVQAEGGDYAEWQDGKPSGNSKGSKGISGGGGGGRIYYEYNIEDQSWDFSVEEGIGNVHMETAFSGDSNKQDDEFKDRVATNGTIESDIAFSSSVNQTIVNDGDSVRVSGTASTNVTIYLNESEVTTVTPSEPSGIYEANVSALDLDSFDEYKNYALRAESSISGRDINGTFDISHRAYEIDQSSDYILRPNQQINVSVNVTKHQNGSQGGHTAIDNVTDRTVKYKRFADATINTTTTQTSSGGLASIEDTVEATEHKQFYKTTTQNNKSINGSQTTEIAWVSVTENNVAYDEFFVDPGEVLGLNGSAHGEVRVYLENRTGSFENLKNISPNETTGYFNTSVQTHQIQKISNLGEYILEIRTDLNGATRTERFTINHRELEILNEPDFLLRPYETLSVSNRSILYREDGPDDVTTESYTGDIALTFKNQSGPKTTRTLTPNQTGHYDFTKTVTPTRERKRYTLKATTTNGVNDAPSDDDIFDTNNQSYGWVTVDDQIIDPGDQITVNGSTHDNVTVELQTPNGSYVTRTTTSNNPSGYFETTISGLTRDKITSVDDIGNYTLRLNTSLNGETRTERFDIAHRELNITHGTDYLLRPQEAFTVSGDATLHVADGSGGSQAEPYASQQLNFSLVEGTTSENDTPETNVDGSFSVSTEAPNATRDVYYTVEDETVNGVDDTVADNDLRDTERKNLAVVRVDDKVVNQGESITVSGTAYNDVNITLDGTQVDGGDVSIGTDDSYTHTFQAPDVSDESEFGNQTLRVKTRLNGETRTEAFNVSIRGIRFDLSTSYPRKVNPGENFTVSGTAEKYTANGSGGADAEPLATETITLTYRGTDGTYEERETTTEADGTFSFDNVASAENAGDRDVILATETENGVSRTRSVELSTRIRVTNGSTGSPTKRLYKDSDRVQTKYVNPEQGVEATVTTRKSTGFVKDVTADITLPNGTTTSTSLNVQDSLGEAYQSSTDWDQANTTHLRHAQTPGGISSDQVRIGASEELDGRVLHYAYETDASPVEDVSGGGLNASSSGTVSLGSNGVFSSQGVRLNGGYLSLSDKPGIGDSFTFTTWLKTDDGGTLYSLASLDGFNKKPQIQIDSTGVVKTEVRNSRSGPILENETGLTDGEWHHFASTFNGTHIEHYVDGDRVGQAVEDVSMPTVSGTPRIGETTVSGSNRYSGYLDETLLFNRSLNATTVERIASRKGQLKTTTTLDKPVKDILKAVNLNISSNDQAVDLVVESDPDGDSAYEEQSDRIDLSDDDRIESITGFENASAAFRTKVNLTTTNASESPILNKFDLKARASDTLTWTEDINLSSLSSRDLGDYNVTFTAQDYEGNVEGTRSETSDFTVKRANLTTDVETEVSPGTTLQINGTIEELRRDEDTIVTHPLNGSVSLRAPGVVKGDNTVDESIRAADLSNGSTKVIPVNGTQSPANETVTFYGSFSGVDETVSWVAPSDWDGMTDTTGITHTSKEDSEQTNTTAKIGYPTYDLNADGSGALAKYYAFDDTALPFNDSVSDTTLDKGGVVETEPGLLNSKAAVFNGTSGAASSSSLIGADGSFTVNAWVKPDNIPDDAGSIQAGPGEPYTVFGVNQTFVVQITDGGDVFLATNVTGLKTTKTSTDAIPADEWSMITLLYNENGPGLTVSYGNGVGQKSSSLSLSSQMDVTGKDWFVGHQPRINQNYFQGGIDELRVYERVAVPFNLRRQIGNPTIEWMITGQKSFSEPINPSSLVLRSEHDLNGQEANITVSGDGNAMNPIVLNEQDRQYSLDAAGIPDTDTFSLNISMTSNTTATPTVDNVTLIRRYATENPRLDIDNDTAAEATFNGRIIEGASQTVPLSNLSTGVNHGVFLSDEGRYDARVNYTEVIANQTTTPIPTDATGSFNDTYTAPNTSGSFNLTTYYTSDDGIFDKATNTINVGLSFTNTTAYDLDNQDTVVEPSERLAVNASIGQHENPLDRVWATLSNESTNLTEITLTGGEDSRSGIINLSDVSPQNGEYNITYFANDTAGLREVRPAKQAIRVTTGDVSVELPNPIVGLTREFTVNGSVRQDLDSRLVNGTATLTVPATGQTLNTTISNGTYQATLTAPETPGAYNVNVSTTDENHVEALNQTTVTVTDTTNLSVEVPESTVSIQGVTLESGVNKAIPINISNTGATDIRNLTVYGTALPEVDETVNILEQFGRDWRSINQTYNVSANTTRTVNATIDVSPGSSGGVDFPLNISTQFTTTGNETKRSDHPITARITESRLPLFQDGEQVTVEDGFEGNFLTPNNTANISLVNEGSATLNDPGWNVSNQRFKDAWIDSFSRARNGDRILNPGSSIGVFEMTGSVPEGTPPGNYTTRLTSFSQNASETNSVNVSVAVENTAEWSYELTPTKQGGTVDIPDTVNGSNRIDIGDIDLSSQEKLFNIRVNNTGNRNLSFEIRSARRDGDLSEIVAVNFTGGTSYNAETYTSSITSDGNYTYRYEDIKANISYNTLTATSLPEVYQANITMTCEAPESCDPNTVTLPIEGTVQNPPPEISDISLPNITGRNDSVTISGQVSDNANNSNIDGVEGLNITITKHLDQIEQTTLIGGEDFVIERPDGAFSTTIKPTKLGRDLEANDHRYGIRFEATDYKGKRQETNTYNMTVRDEAQNVGMELNRSSITLDEVNATSGDTATLSGVVTSGDVEIIGPDLSFLLDETSSPLADADQVNFTGNTDRDIDTPLSPGENHSFNVEIQAAPNVDPSTVFTGGIQVAWQDPNGDSETQFEQSVEVGASANKILEMTGPDSVTVPHNSTTPFNVTIKSLGNTELRNVDITCQGCTDDLGITATSRNSFNVVNGEQATITVNATAAAYERPTSQNVSITASSDDEEASIQTDLFVPPERSVALTPSNITAFFPADQGTINLGTITAKNTGNQDLEPLAVDNPRGSTFYLGANDSAPFTADLGPGEQTTFATRADSDLTPPQTTNDTVDPSSSTSLDSYDTTKLILFIQDIGFDVTSINKTGNVTHDESLAATFNLTQEDQPVNQSQSVTFSYEANGTTNTLNATYDNQTSLWTAVFPAPDIEDGVSHLFTFEASSDAFLSSVTTQETIHYEDVSPPEYIETSSQPVTQGNSSIIGTTVTDRSNIVGGVEARIVTPSETSIYTDLSSQTEDNLSELNEKQWEANFTNTSSLGRYKVTFTAQDALNNTGTSSPEYFRVFEPLRVEGDAGDPSNTTEIELVDAAGDVAETIKPEAESYNETIRSGTYSTGRIEVDNDKSARVQNLSASSIQADPPRFESSIPDTRVSTDRDYLKGFALESETFDDIDGTVAFSYQDVVDTVEFQGNLQVMKCEDYNLSRAAPCESEYEPIPEARTGVDPVSRTVAVSNIDGFSSYLLVENTSSSEDTSLNVNLSGEIGDLGDLSGLQSTLEQVASNTEGLEGGTSGGSSSGSGGGSSDDTGSEDLPDALDDIASELNESGQNPDLAIGNNEISVEIQPGENKSTAISIQNPKDEPVNISLDATDNLDDFLSFSNTVSLSPGEFKTVRINVDATNTTELREITGFIQVDGPNNQRSVPVSVETVSSENRLLDVSLTPQVDEFGPGETAQFKLSLNNQGYSRAVDAEATIQIRDIANGVVIARTTETYAVQTTLDRLVNLDIPESTDLGTYAARATVKYSNIPNERNATAVAQVTIQRPFLERTTFGVSNTYLLTGLVVLLMVSSAAGYWYYRKKKLEAKRKRFEEQVDNDSIPSEAGRTAFVGSLAEIGTRAFIELDDLMTHCLTAGATGAGKSVAAQVIVEEALEQGVNVIVLDPTGQWSGYLDKNDNDEFFAFYDDFGMQRGDARSYEGNIRAVDAEQDTIDITDVMRPEGDEGSIHVFSMHKLGNADLEAYLSDTIQQIFDYNPEEKDHLETLIVYDEAHRVLEKFGGTGRGATMLERGAREFRKWGTGMLVISQVIEDFPEEVRANIGTQIQMRTEYEGDLDRIERKYGNHITQGVTKANTGTGMMQNSSYNHGRPYFVDFRPIKHSPERLSDTELDKFEKYNRRVDEVQDLIHILEDQDQDVFEYKSQLKLVKKNIRKRSFNLVDTYLNELEEDLEKAL